ncbi:MAG TPA: hypothetical protein PK121_02665, partial [Candidatus Pacearchaeota archaeon]|nr:hypothetical protein [Candidatus Pacearchaeota archaeon]
ASFDFELSTTSSSLSLPIITQIGGVRPNSSQTVNFSITAPSNSGEYPFTVKVIKNKDRTYHKAEKSLNLNAIVSSIVINESLLSFSSKLFLIKDQLATISQSLSILSQKINEIFGR